MAVWVTLIAPGATLSDGRGDRQAALLACAFIFIARAALTLFVYVKRRIPWWEAAWGAVGIGLSLFLLLRHGMRVSQPLGFVDVPGIFLYATGSYLGTASEYSRHVWKARAENQGHLYTEGLFRLSRHINYFGDLLLFLGFAMLTRQLWTGIIPLAMGLNFVLFVIPAHDAYLRNRYAGEYEDYARSTKRLVPFLY